MTEVLRRWCEDATGPLGWIPEQFWSATPVELFMAIAGHNRANRAGSEPMTGEGLKELEAAYPDGGSIRA